MASFKKSLALPGKSLALPGKSPALPGKSPALPGFFVSEGVRNMTAADYHGPRG